VPDEPATPRQPIRLSPSDPLVALSRWVAEGSSDQAALARARQHWLERRAEEEATLVGSIIDLAERGQAITIATTAGGRHTGAVVAVGSDFAILRVHRFGDIVIRHDAIAFLRPFPGDNTPTGDRPLEINLALADALVELSAERPRVQIATGGEELTGELRSAGYNVLALRLDNPRRATVHIAINVIDHLVILSR
jgi:hypothetical protein